MNKVQCPMCGRQVRVTKKRHLDQHIAMNKKVCMFSGAPVSVVQTPKR